MARKGLIWAGGGLGVVLLMGALVPFFLDWNWYKPRLIAAAEEASGRTIRVDGDLRFALFPTPSLKADGVTVEGFGGAREPLLRASSLGVGVKLLPLLRKQVSVQYVSLDDPQVTLVAYPDGTTNWTRTDDSKDTQDSGSLVIDDIRIRNGSVTYVSADGSRQQADKLDLKLAIPGGNEAMSAAGTLTYKGLPVGLDATINTTTETRAKLTFGEDEGALDLLWPMSDAPLKRATFTLTAPDLSKLLARVGEKKADDKPSTVLAKPLDLRGDIEIGPDGKRIDRARFRLGPANGTLSARLPNDASPIGASLALGPVKAEDWQSVDDDEPTKFPYPLDLPADLNARVDLSIERLTKGRLVLGRIHAPMTLAKGVLTLSPTSIALPGNGTARLSGTVRSVGGFAEASAAFSLDAPSLRPVLAGLDMAPAMAGLRSASLTGQVSLKGDRLNVQNLAGRLDQSTLGGTVSGRLAETPHWTIVGTLDQIDLAQYRAQGPAKASEGPAPAADFNLRIGALRNGASTYRDVVAQGSLADDRLTLTAASIGDAAGYKVTAKGTVDTVSKTPNTDLALGLTGARVSGTVTVKGPTDALATHAVLSASGARIDATGMVRSGATTGLDFDVKVQAADFAQVLNTLSPKPGRNGIGPLDLSLKMTGTTDQIAVQGLSGQMGPTTLSGQGRIVLGATTPVVNLTLNAGAIPARRFMGPAATGAQAAAINPDQRWSKLPLDLSLADTFDGTITINAKSFDLDGMVLSSPRIVIASPGRTLQIQSFTGKLLNGTVDASLALNGTGAVPTLATKFAMSGVPVETITQTFAASKPATGTMRFSGQFNAAGASQHAMVQALNGQAHVAAENGVVRRVDLKQLNQRLASLTTVADFVRLTGTALTGGETAYRSLSADLVTKNGVMQVQNAKSDMDGGDVTMTGKIDLPRWLVDLNAKIALEADTRAPPVGMRLAGPLHAPNRTFETGGISKYFLTRGLLAIGKAGKGEGVGLQDLLGVKKPATAAQATEQGGTSATQQTETKPKAPEDELKGLAIEGLQSLFKKKKPAPAPAQ